MADVQAAIRSRLLEHAGTLALIGANGAWFVHLPQNPTYPAATVRQEGGDRHSAMGADVGIAEGTIAVDLWADTRAGVKALAEQARAALQRYRGTLGGTVIHATFFDAEFDLDEPGVNKWRIHQKYTVKWGEA